MTRIIRFYGPNAPFGEFSNYALYPIQIRGTLWPTSEHYFQAQKLVEKSDQEAIRRIRKPKAAARMGRDRQRKIRKDWESVKVKIMRDAVMAKFSQHPELRELLLFKGDAKIVEHGSWDTFWADGADGSGKNMLGIILMKTRERLRNQS